MIRSLSHALNRKHPHSFPFAGTPLAVILVAGIIYVVLFAFNSMTRTRNFSLDSMNYVNVARNITAGAGITQPTLGFNQPRFSMDDEIPSPMTAQAPLYPVLIALVSQTGISPDNGALLLSAAGLGFVLLLTFLLADTLYDKDVALLSTALLLLYHPLLEVARFAWTETIGITFVLLVFWLLAIARARNCSWCIACAGLAAGLAFATRYALLPLFCVGALFLLVDTGWKARFRNAFLYAAGFAIPAGLVLTRNFLIMGTMMPFAYPSNVGAKENTIDALNALFGGYRGALLLGFSLLVIGAVIIARGDARSVRELLFARGRFVLGLWSLTYVAFLIYQRSHSNFNAIDARLIAPAGPTLIVLWSALAMWATRPVHAWIKSFALAVLLIAVWRELEMTRTPARTLQQAINESERLTWVARHTSAHDLIIGDNTVDIPFYLQRPFTISFSPYPYTDNPSYENFVAFSRRNCGRFRNIYLVLHKEEWRREIIWRREYGIFFADLVAGRTEKYPAVSPLHVLRDAYVFQILCPGGEERAST